MPGKAIADIIDFNKSEQYILSIRLGTDGFSFSIYNPIRDTLVLTRRQETEAGLSLTANMRKAFRELDFLGYAYKKINVFPVSKRFTLIPLTLFAEDQVETCFYYNFSPKENETILYDILPGNEAVILYAIDKSLYHLLQEQYGQVRFHSSVTFPAEHFAAKSRFGSDKKMYARLHEELIEIYAYERGHLMLLNAYQCKHTSDRLYYLLYAWKLLAMDQQTDELYFMSDDERKNELIEEARRFIRHVTLLNPIPELNYL